MATERGEEGPNATVPDTSGGCTAESGLNPRATKGGKEGPDGIHLGTDASHGWPACDNELIAGKRPGRVLAAGSIEHSMHQRS